MRVLFFPAFLSDVYGYGSTFQIDRSCSSEYVVAVGAHNLRERCTNPCKLIRVQKVYTHEDFRLAKDRDVADISVLRLE